MISAGIKYGLYTSSHHLCDDQDMVDGEMFFCSDCTYLGCNNLDMLTHPYSDTPFSQSKDQISKL